MSLAVVVSHIVVLSLGLSVSLFSAWGVARPASLVRLVSSVLDRKWGIYAGVIVRLVLGIALIIAAPSSSFPLVFRVLGLIAILAAFALVMMGRETTRKLVAWFEQLRTPFLRLWLVFGMAFGVFLVFGSW